MVERGRLYEQSVNLDTPQPVPQQWTWKAVNCKTVAWSKAPLLFYRRTYNNYSKTWASLMSRDTVHRPRVSRYGLKFLFCSSRWCLKRANWWLLMLIFTNWPKEFLLRQDNEKYVDLYSCMITLLYMRPIKTKNSLSALKYDDIQHWSCRFLFISFSAALPSRWSI